MSERLDLDGLERCPDRASYGEIVALIARVRELEAAAKTIQDAVSNLLKIHDKLKAEANRVREIEEELERHKSNSDDYRHGYLKAEARVKELEGAAERSAHTIDGLIKERDAAEELCVKWRETVREQGGHAAGCALFEDGSSECVEGCEAFGEPDHKSTGRDE